QQLLDLTREQVLPAGDDHVVVAPIDEQPPIGVEVPDVPSAHQAVDRLLRTAARVTVELEAVADEDTAGTAWPLDGTALGVEQADHRPERDPSRAAWSGAQILRRGERRVRDFGRTVEVVEHVA